MQNPYAINSSKIESLLRRFITRTYSSYDSKQDSYDQTIIDTCIHFWQRDYICEIIENKNGDLCSTYPSRIPIPIQEHAVDGKVMNKSVLSTVRQKASKQGNGNLDETNSKCKFESGSDKSNNNLDTTDSCLCRKALAFDNPDDIHFRAVFHNTIELKNGIDSQSFAEIINSSQSEIKAGSKNNTDNMQDSTYSLDQYRSDKMSASDDADIIHIKEPNEQNELISSPSRELRTLPTFNVSENRGMKALHTSSFERVPLTRLHEVAPNSVGQDSNSLTNYIKRSIKARCWYRFPVPSILCNNKFVCRSATISCFVDVCGKSIWEKLDFSCESCEILEEELGPDHAHGLAEARSNDIRFLKKLAISAIMDLMVESKKKKWGFKSCSSEKADSERRYSDFNIFSIPYPGCEFFTEFTKNHKSSENLYYNWEPSFNDAKLTIPEAVISPRVCTNWSNYKEWDLRTLTENYLKLIIGHITEEDVNESGFLVHCISGWDRTPLFISLIRLTLWADGLIHSSLNAKEILYFTLAYDWYLFGHNLPDRLKSEENILYFCFEFLDVIGNESFMDMSERRTRHPSNGSSASGAYDGATEGNETTSSSFGSVTSLASSSSNPPSVASLAPNIKVSSLKQTSESVLSGLWPFNKENGFSFEGIADNDPPVNLSSGTENTLSTKKYSKNSPVRSPLKEHNKGSPKTTPSPSGKRGSGRRANLNGVLRESSMGKRSRKSSTDSLGSRVGERPTSESSTSTEEFVNVSDSELAHSGHHLKAASTPVPVPGGRSRHNSSSSVGGSWQMISAPEDPVSYSFESMKSFCKASSTADMIDSTHTIREEVSPSSSAGSSHSITVFNRKRRLSKVREIFVEVYRRLNESKKS